MSSDVRLKAMYRDPWNLRDRLASRLRLVRNQSMWKTWGYSPSKARKVQRLERGPMWLYRNRQALRRYQAAVWSNWALRPEWRRVLSRRSDKLR